MRHRRWSRSRTAIRNATVLLATGAVVASCGHPPPHDGHHLVSPTATVDAAVDGVPDAPMDGSPGGEPPIGVGVGGTDSAGGDGADEAEEAEEDTGPGMPSPSPTPSPAPPQEPGPDEAPDGDAIDEEECLVDEILEPDCGVWWGASPGDRNIRRLEELTGRTMDIVYVWHGVDETTFPTAHERELVAEGRFLHANVEARRFNLPGNPDLRYRQILSGQFDASIIRQARNFADLGVPAFVTFDHEADANRRYNRRGTPQEFVQAWRHIVDLYRANGADNVIWVWNVTGWRGNFHRLPGLWPGNDHVDWISWEGYNMTGCVQHPTWTYVRTFEESVSPMYEWLAEHGEEHDIDIGKPVMIGEMGTVPLAGDPLASFYWYRDIPDVLAEYERIRAVKLWDSHTAPSCDFRVMNHIATKLGFVAASRHPYVNIPDDVRKAALGLGGEVD